MKCCGSVVLEDATGGGHVDATGDAYLSGTYAVVGTPVRVLNRFNDGNTCVVEDHTTTALAVSDAALDAAVPDPARDRKDRFVEVD